MNDCDQIGPLLGPFRDGELQPAEMQQVARHLAGCTSCDEIVGEFNSLGRELRDVISVPPLTGFVASVNARLDQRAIVPLRERIQGFFGGINQRWAAAVAMVSMAGAVAVLTALVLTPYLRRNLATGAQAVPMAKADTTQAPSLASATPPESAHFVSIEPSQDLASTSEMNPGDSYAVIRRLESQIPTTAVWSEPKNETTVIWLPSD